MSKLNLIGMSKSEITHQKIQVNFICLFFLVIAIAANKSDMYEHEEVDESEGRNFAKEIGAIFRYTSAKNSSNIDDLFKAIGNKIIDPNYEEGGKIEEDPEHEKIRSQTIKITQKPTNSNNENKKECGC